MSAQSFTIEVENLKCGGCATTITKTLSQMAGVTGVTVDPDIKSVSFIGTTSLCRLLSRRKSRRNTPEFGLKENGEVTWPRVNLNVRSRM